MEHPDLPDANVSLAGSVSSEARLDELFRAYRNACPEVEATPVFMPQVWARIETRQHSSTVFTRLARGLVTAALAASVILALMVSFRESSEPLNETYIEAVAADHLSSLGAFQIERISELDPQ
jgi:hypothetical protein